MSLYRQQALIDAPVEAIWRLVGDVERHPEWWPGIIEVECEGLTEGCTYRAVSKGPLGTIDNAISVERLDGCHELFIRCLNTGMYTRWLLTEAQGGTFVDAEFGMDPQTVRTRIFDTVAGKRYFRRWLEQSLDGLSRAARAGALT